MESRDLCHLFPILMLLLLHSPTAAIASHHHAQATIKLQGFAVCDACRQNRLSYLSVPLSGASVTLTCKGPAGTPRTQRRNGGRAAATWAMMRKTLSDRWGMFSFELPMKQMKLLSQCRVALTSSPWPACAQASRSASRLLLSPLERLIPRNSLQSHDITGLPTIFSLGWVSYQPRFLPTFCSLWNDGERLGWSSLKPYYHSSTPSKRRLYDTKNSAVQIFSKLSNTKFSAGESLSASPWSWPPFPPFLHPPSPGLSWNFFPPFSGSNPFPFPAVPSAPPILGSPSPFSWFPPFPSVPPFSFPPFPFPFSPPGAHDKSTSASVPRNINFPMDRPLWPPPPPNALDSASLPTRVRAPLISFSPPSSQVPPPSLTRLSSNLASPSATPISALNHVVQASNSP
ncbi:hypothetical protein KP509_22G064600 [Ceratopteris richardii]|uniref:Uncharacterized protein n=1 Tax=Ceratopteris richardii TaxID=49495 RepID=A0A8T2S5W3_CERRI|nr:hypothetical protein KP509_22G064600 [Ceratopteris richardii]